ncbi:MAG: TetR/AcrR family transcriptional regulator [Desulfobacteraceae bacterium]|jgi:AcrR family transcriptional regulator|nr:MAG: TetR/AcrR family transcriptional regulator [Desulfobacteraceae bacterium]
MHQEKPESGNQYEKIVAIASRLMSEKGYKGASLQEIADRVGIHKSTFFHYFKNKEELLLAVLRIAIEDVAKNVNLILEDDSLSPQEKLKRAICNHLKLLVKYKYNVNVYHSEIRFLSDEKRKQYLETRKYYAACFEQIVNEIKGGDSGLFEGLDSKIVAFGILGMSNWTIKWLSGSGRLSTEEVADVFYKMIARRGNSQ